MLAPTTTAAASALWREQAEPRMSSSIARLQGLAHGTLKALLFLGATTVAVSTVVLLRIVLTAHRVPRWEAELMQIMFPG
jgi:hypothetical protein